MKFGRLIYQYTGKTVVDGTAIFNIGDNFQTYAIDNIYKRLGVSEKDIIDINCSEMKNYDGEYVIVLMAGYASHYKRFNQLPTSDKIIPLFVSFEMSDESCDDIVPYLKKHMPIGCRDEHTMNLLRRKGIEAYTSGCLTITLPRRKKEPKNGKVFFVDIPSELEKYIPEKLKKNCEYAKHEGQIGHAPMTYEDCKKIDLYARETLNKYRDEAILVVTSRLHAASPCIALGIPVILAIDNIDGRFSWLDKLIPIYDRERYNEIDWNPDIIDIEELKEQIITLVCDKLKSLYENKKGIYELSQFWENRSKATYNRVLCERLKYLRQKYSREDPFSYIVWGAGVHGKLAYSMINEYFSNAQLLAIVDNYMDGTLFDVDIIKPQKVREMRFDYVLITTHPGRFEAVEILTDMGKKKNTDWCYFISKDIPEENDIEE